MSTGSSVLVQTLLLPPLPPTRLVGFGWGKIPAAATIASYSFYPAMASRAASHGLNILRGSSNFGNSTPNIYLQKSRHRHHGLCLLLRVEQGEDNSFGVDRFSADVLPQILNVPI